MKDYSDFLVSECFCRTYLWAAAWRNRFACWPNLKRFMTQRRRGLMFPIRIDSAGFPMLLPVGMYRPTRITRLPPELLASNRQKRSNHDLALHYHS